MIVAGQVHGGSAGIGQALLEGCVRQGDRPVADRLLNDYAMPRPNNATDPLHVPRRKGCGEAGAIGAPAAIADAMR